MRTHIPLTLGLALLLVAATACSSGSSRPAPVANYGPATGATSSSVGSPDAGGYSTYNTPAAPAAPAPAMTSSGPIRWHYRLADAQAEARASGKMILVASTKPRCSLCVKFKEQIAPAAGSELARVAVGYVYDITRPEVRDVDRLLRANLRGADLMPLVGFITPELGWVHGFWGARTVQQFRGDIARAASIHPVRTAAVRVQGPTPAPRSAALDGAGFVTNEFGEREWGRASDIWPQGDPEPIDAITGAPEGLPDTVPAPAGTVAPGQPAGAMLADATTATPTADPAPLPEAPAPAGPGAGLPPIQPKTTVTVAEAPATPEPAASTPAAAQPAPAPATRDETWGRQALQRALLQIRAGEFDRARTILADVREALPDTQLAREASKGGVALYNAKRIRFASSGSERNRYLERARRDFSNSIWAPLFDA